jgi:TPR repeat protein
MKKLTPKFWLETLIVLKYRRAAKHGNAKAQLRLGFCYYEGAGVDKDDALAVEWYRKAAEQGYAPAQCELGICYCDGTGVDKDYSQAIEWLRKATKQGFAPAQYRLGFVTSLEMVSTKITSRLQDGIEWLPSKAAMPLNAIWDFVTAMVPESI